MPDQLRAYEISIAELFSDRFNFTVPAFQRPYAWTTEHTGELLEDIEHAVAQHQPGAPPYFLGTLVITKPDSEPQSDVIDGQQRLATLTILLAVIRDISPTDIADQLDAFIRQPSNIFHGVDQNYRVNIREQDRLIFKRHIQSRDATSRLPDPGTVESDSQRMIIENALFLRDRLLQTTHEARVALLKYVMKNCCLVVVQANDSEAAYRVFSVMNDRGLELSPTDVLKAEIIGSAHPSARRDCTETWEFLEDSLGRDRFRDLFGHLDFLFRGQKRRTSLEQSFRESVLRKVGAEDFIENYLYPLGDAYLSVVECSFAGSEHQNEINSLLKKLNLLDFGDWQIAALTAVAKFKDRPKDLVFILKQRDRLSYSFLIRKTHVSARTKRYAEILSELIDTNECPRSSGPLALTTFEAAETRKELDGPIYQSKRACKLVMLRLDEALSDGHATYDHSVVSVEHILPQNPDPSGPWCKSFPNAQLREHWLHRLGNLALLSRRKNASASNLPFNEKKEKYFKLGDASSFVVTSHLANFAEWNPSTLQRRHEQLTKCLWQLWDLEISDPANFRLAVAAE